MEPTVVSMDLEQYCDKLLDSWRGYFSSQQYEQCSQLTRTFINDLKPIFKGRPYGEDEDAKESYAYIYLFLMLAKALEDITSLVGLTKDKNWPYDHKAVEAIWQVLWDAKERLDVFDSHCSERMVDDLYAQLKKLELCFYDFFGKGLYVSPVVVIRKATCSICGINIKGCSHIPGNLYHGKPCKEIVEDCEFRSVDLVQSPHDMRCRVWPWKFKDNMSFEVVFMSLNELDGFIDE